MVNDHLGQKATLVFVYGKMATFSKMPDGYIVFVYGKWPPFLKWQRATLLLFVNGKWSLKWQMAIHIFMANGHKE